MVQGNFEHLFYKIPAKLLGAEQVQGLRNKIGAESPSASCHSSDFLDLMWHSSMKDWFIDLVLNWVLTPVRPGLLGLQEENKLCLAELTPNPLQILP